MKTIVPPWLAVLYASLIFFAVAGVMTMCGYELVAAGMSLVYLIGAFWALPSTASKPVEVWHRVDTPVDPQTLAMLIRRAHPGRIE